MQRISANNESIIADNGIRKWGLYEGHLPHVADAINLFDEAWRHTSRASDIKCWIKLSFEEFKRSLRSLMHMDEEQFDLTSETNTIEDTVTRENIWVDLPRRK